LMTGSVTGAHPCYTGGLRVPSLKASGIGTYAFSKASSADQAAEGVVGRWLWLNQGNLILARIEVCTDTGLFPGSCSPVSCRGCYGDSPECGESCSQILISWNASAKTSNKLDLEGWPRLRSKLSHLISLWASFSSSGKWGR
jgi:hypothetical protein